MRLGKSSARFIALRVTAAFMISGSTPENGWLINVRPSSRLRLRAPVFLRRRCLGFIIRVRAFIGAQIVGAFVAVALGSGSGEIHLESRLDSSPAYPKRG
jgi:hypothetical protein